MSSEKKQDDLKSFEAALAGLVPRTDRLDRDRLMFLAGQQSLLNHSPLPLGEGQGEGRKQSRAWPTAFTAMTTVAAILFIMLLHKSEPQIVERIIEKTVPNTLAASESNSSRKTSTDFTLAFLTLTDKHDRDPSDSAYSYTSLREQILTDGVDSWKPTTSKTNLTETHSNKSNYTHPLTNRELMREMLSQTDGPG